MEISKLALAFAAAFGLLAVMLGAFGAHALESQLSAKSLATWATATQYQMYHALLLLFLGMAMLHIGPVPALRWSAYLAAAGVVLFSGSLYGLALGAPRWLGPITPIGGVCFIASWTALLWAAISGLKSP